MEASSQDPAHSLHQRPCYQLRRAHCTVHDQKIFCLCLLVFTFVLVQKNVRPLELLES